MWATRNSDSRKSSGSTVLTDPRAPPATTSSRDRLHGCGTGDRAEVLESARIVQLIDREATRDSIRLALKRLAGTHIGDVPPGVPSVVAALSAATPADAVIVYFAGHGVANSERFRFVVPDAVHAAPAG
jgi:hypothetical protein